MENDCSDATARAAWASINSCVIFIAKNQEKGTRIAVRLQSYSCNLALMDMDKPTT
jgi:hypothetical protein